MSCVALIIGGGGEHGLARLRKQRAGDPVPLSFDEQYSRYELSGEPLWNTGVIPGSGHAGASFALKYGFDGHNYAVCNVI